MTNKRRQKYDLLGGGNKLINEIKKIITFTVRKQDWHIAVLIKYQPEDLNTSNGS